MNQPDIADIIAGALQTSRAHAYELMRAALPAEKAVERSPWHNADTGVYGSEYQGQIAPPAQAAEPAQADEAARLADECRTTATRYRNERTNSFAAQEAWEQFSKALDKLAALTQRPAAPAAVLLRLKTWGLCTTCRHDKIPGEACAREDCPERPAQGEALEPHPPHRQCGCPDCAPSFAQGEVELLHYDEQQIADACVTAEISDSKCQSLLIALQETAPRAPEGGRTDTGEKE